MVKTVEAPPELHPTIESIEAKYEDIMSKELKYLPEKSRIQLVGENVMFIGLKSIGISLKDELDSVLGVSGRNIVIYRLGQAFGRSEAQRLLPILGYTDPVRRLLAGPIWAAYSGFVRVRLLPGSNVASDENYFLFYEHPDNFEAQLWKAAGRTSHDPVCHFNAGYSSGWCSVATGLELDAEEVMCEAAGHKVCRFIMYPSSKRLLYQEKLDEYRK
ncbi:MAG: V4R domain-containing protein [Candidatus Thorarchaeota archaeon]